MENQIDKVNKAEKIQLAKWRKIKRLARPRTNYTQMIFEAQGLFIAQWEKANYEIVLSEDELPE